MPALSTSQAARFQAAVQVIGQQIAELSSAIEVERRASHPNERHVLDLSEQREQLTDAQELLSPSDTDAIDRVLAGAAQ